MSNYDSSNVLASIGDVQYLCGGEMRESADSILIGAESGQTESDIGLRSLYLTKLQKYPSAPLAWGATGNPTIGINRFGSWLSQFDWPPTDWPSFQNEVVKQLSSLNGWQREMSKLAGVEAKSELLAEVLIVGWLDTSSIFAVDDEGALVVPDKDMEFYAIGSGGVHARLICTAFTAVNVNAPVIERFKIILHIATNVAPECAPPIHIWRVREDGVTEIDLSKP